MPTTPHNQGFSLRHPKVKARRRSTPFKPESPAISREDVCRVVSTFLYSTSGRNPVQNAIQESVRDVVHRITSNGWTAYLVGGTVRDLVLSPRCDRAIQPRDIDLVVIGASVDELKQVFQDLYLRTTRFRGLHLADPKPGGWKILFDIWPLEETWGFSANTHLSRCIENFPQLPFLNLDTAAIEITARQRRATLFELGFLSGINGRILEVNFEPNPFPELCIVRSLLMAAKLNFSLGPRLASYIGNHARRTSVNDMMQAQLSHYGKYRCTVGELSSWLSRVERATSEGAVPVNIPANSQRQLELWRDYPDRDTSTSVLTPR